MPAPLQLFFELFEFGAHPFRDRDASQHEPPAPGRPTDVGEPKESEGLGPAQAAPCSPFRGVPSELDQARLVGRRLQAELRQSCAKVSKEPARVAFVLEPHHDIVGLCRAPDYAEGGDKGAGQRAERFVVVGIIRGG